MNTSYPILRIGVFVALAIYHHYQWSRRAWFEAEIKRNDEFEAPSDRQLKWDLRHMREDLYLIAISLNFLTFLGIGYVVWHW